VVLKLAEHPIERRRQHADLVIGSDLDLLLEASLRGCLRAGLEQREGARDPAHERQAQPQADEQKADAEHSVAVAQRVDVPLQLRGRHADAHGAELLCAQIHGLDGVQAISIQDQRPTAALPGGAAQGIVDGVEQIVVADLAVDDQAILGIEHVGVDDVLAPLHVLHDDAQLVDAQIGQVIAGEIGEHRGDAAGFALQAVLDHPLLGDDVHRDEHRGEGRQQNADEQADLAAETVGQPVPGARQPSQSHHRLGQQPERNCRRASW
jgi:hypothetical protein